MPTVQLKPHSIQRLLYAIDCRYGTRFLTSYVNLDSQEKQEVAAFGIARHIKACKKNGVAIGFDAITEIMRDASNGLAIAKEMASDAAVVRDMAQDVSNVRRVFDYHNDGGVNKKRK